MSKMGRGSIYGPKDGDRVQGTLTKEGAKMFERLRQWLQQDTKRPSVSDADTIEYLTRREYDRNW